MTDFFYKYFLHDLGEIGSKNELKLRQPHQIEKINPTETNETELSEKEENKSFCPEQSTQCSENCVSQAEYDALQSEISVLQAELFKSEENYNNLLAEHEECKVSTDRIQELISEKDKIQLEFENFKKFTENENLLALKKILLEQIKHSRNFYLDYVAIFKNKCKNMIWELEDIKTLTTAETLPSRQEIDDNLHMWRQALRATTQNHAAVIIYFEKLFERFTIDPIKDICSTPFPALILEPPSVIHRHFKSFFLVNKRLEQDLNRQMANYYKMLSMPYPGIFPYKMAPSPPIEGATSVDPEMKIINPPPGMGGEPVTLAQEQSLLTVTEPQPQEHAQDHEPEQQIPQPVEELAEAKAEDLSKFLVDVSQSEDSEFKVVVGPDGLMYRLQQRYPLTPPRILQEAVQHLRSARGGLSGLDSKTLFGELRVIIADLSKRERQKLGQRGDVERRRKRRSTQKYRTAHATRERIKIETYNEAFAKLRKQMFPNLSPDKKLSKIEILKLAIFYTGYLNLRLNIN